MEKERKSSVSLGGNGGINTLVHGTSMEGQLSADNDIRIDGQLKGNLTCKGKVIVGPTGNIVGDVVCANAVIEGSLSGTLKVEEVLSVRETAKIEGDITTNKLVVQSGAVFNVNCVMGGQRIKPLGSSSSSTQKESSKVKEDSLTLN